MSDPFGFLVVDKPQGMTSHDVVARVRRLAKVQKIGHAGTLDPMATGVLILCIGGATRLSEYVMGADKLYLATARLGIETNTYDADGQIVAEYSTDHLNLNQVKQALYALQGEVDQIPPMFAAIKKNGKKLYELARAGQHIEIPPRRVSITVLQIDSQVALPDVRFLVSCSSGTYVRSIAHDLGASLGVGAHLIALSRVSSGRLSDPIPYDDLLTAIENENWQHLLRNEKEAIPDIEERVFDPDQVRDILQGKQIGRPERDLYLDLCRAYTDASGEDKRFFALLRGDGEFWQPHKVFPDQLSPDGDEQE